MLSLNTYVTTEAKKKSAPVFSRPVLSYFSFKWTPIKMGTNPLSITINLVDVYAFHNHNAETFEGIFTIFEFTNANFFF